MKKAVLFTLLAGCTCVSAVLSAPIQRGVASRADAVGARDLLNQEGRLLGRGDLSGLYALMTPRYRALCDHEQFARAYPATPISNIVNGTTVSYEGVQIEVVGREARLAYDMTSNGRAVLSVPQGYPDVYQYLGGHWRDDRRGDAGCYTLQIIKN